MPNNTAQGQMGGYLYQLQYALLHILNNDTNYEPNTKILIENYDDVAFETGGTPKEILQTKHSLNSKKNMGDLDQDFWKTLYNWIGLYEEFKQDNIVLPYFFLITTSSIENNYAKFLTYHDRDIEKAIKQLDQLHSDSEDLSRYINKYSNLCQESKQELLNQIYILGSTPQAKDITSKIRQKLKVSILPRASDTLLNEFIAWWYKFCIDLLSEGTELLYCHIQSKYQELQSKNTKKLKTDDLINHGSLDIEATFIKQLSIIDYHRFHELAHEQYTWAFHHRGKWLQDGSVTDSELSNYDGGLCKEWNHQKLTHLYNKSITEISMGENLYNTCVIDYKPNLLCLHDCIDPLLLQGSYHILSNDKKIGWHPKYQHLI